eukprot:2736867-Amphidinium_carterae.2
MPSCEPLKEGQSLFKLVPRTYLVEVVKPIYEYVERIVDVPYETITEQIVEVPKVLSCSTLQRLAVLLCDKGSGATKNFCILSRHPALPACLASTGSLPKFVGDACTAASLIEGGLCHYCGSKEADCRGRRLADDGCVLISEERTVGDVSLRTE